MKIRSTLLVNIAGLVFAVVMRSLFCTLRRTTETAPGSNPYDRQDDQRFLYSVWHDSMLVAAFGGKQVRMAALTSRHRDGSFVASVLKSIGMPIVRGSSSAGGGQALRELITVARDHSIVITPDGPRGPYRQVSEGIIFLAAKTGSGIIPTAFVCHNGWQVPGSWTHLTIPKPFSRVTLRAGDPIYVPSNVKRTDWPDYVMRIQQAMDRLNDACPLPNSMPTVRTS